MSDSYQFEVQELQESRPERMNSPGRRVTESQPIWSKSWTTFAYSIQPNDDWAAETFRIGSLLSRSSATIPLVQRHLCFLGQCTCSVMAPVTDKPSCHPSPNISRIILSMLRT